MRSLIPILILTLLCIFPLPAAHGESPAQRVETVSAYVPADPASLRPTRTYFSSTTASEREMLDFRRDLIANGARHVNYFTPDVIVCELPMDLNVSALSSFPSVVSTDESAVAPYRSSGVSDRESQVRLYYQRTERMQQEKKSPNRSGTQGESFRDVVLTISPEQAEEIQKQLVAAGAATEDERALHQNAEFWGGDVLVQLVLPESNGEFEAETEDWTAGALDAAVSGAVSGMMAVQQQFPNMPLHYVFEVYRQAESGYEPIKHKMGSDGPWIIDTMMRLDRHLVGDGALAIVHEFNNKGRRRYGTDFVFTAFIANSENAPGNIFHGADYTAYANLGGPYQITPYPAGRDPNAIGNWLVFSQIFQHETGHIFWALDEYINEDYNCHDRSGYLNYENLNKLSNISGEIMNCLPEILDCLMQNAAREDIGRPWCRYTQGQMGIVDWNENSIPDIYESEPIIEFETALVETVLTDEVTIRFTAKSTAVPNRNSKQPVQGRIEYASPLDEGRYSIYGLADTKFQPNDGTWNEAEEEAAFRVVSLPSGLLTIQVKVKNAVGIWSDYYRKDVFFIGINYTKSTISVDPGVIRFTWNVAGESFGAVFDVYRVDPGGDEEGRLVAEDVPPAGPPRYGSVPYEFEDRDVIPGIDYRYYAKARFTLDIGGEPRDFTYTSDVLKETAMFAIPQGKIISNAAPNPFREEVNVSVSVPPTYEGFDAGAASGVSGVSSAFVTRKPTEVEIAVYDVLGRRVKTLRSEGVFSDVITLSWDGTNANNQRVPSGVYFVRAQAGGTTGVQKVLLIR